MKNKVALVFCEIPNAMQAIVLLTNQKAETQYNTDWVKKKIWQNHTKSLYLLSLKTLSNPNVWNGLSGCALSTSSQ